MKLSIQTVLEVRLLRVEHSDSLGPLVRLLMSKYNPVSFCFEINEHRLNVTLEDVLFLTGLPIQGKPVIPQISRDLKAFKNLFGIEEQQVSINCLKSIATDNKRDREKRKIAVLLIIVDCMVCSNQNGQVCNTTYAQFVSNLDIVDSYAWGAAMLSYLYYGITKSVENSKKTLDGNIWLILSFFLIRIPKLQSALKIQLDLGEVPLLSSVVKAVAPINKNRKPKYMDDVKRILEDLCDEDILWRPYHAERMRLPTPLRNQVKFGTLVTPLFCFDKVVHHRPNVVAKQFKVFDEFMVDSLDHTFHEIKYKHNRGPSEIDFMDFYKKELAMWNSQKLAEAHMVPRDTHQVSSSTSGVPRDTHQVSSSTSGQLQSAPRLVEELDQPLHNGFQFFANVDNGDDRETPGANDDSDGDDQETASTNGHLFPQSGGDILATHDEATHDDEADELPESSAGGGEANSSRGGGEENSFESGEGNLPKRKIKPPKRFIEEATGKKQALRKKRVPKKRNSE